MKYLILIIFGSLLSVTFTMDAEAQILNRLKKRAQEAAEQRAEEKIAQELEKAAQEMVNRSWDSVFGEINTDSLDQGTIPFMLNSNVETEDTYIFNTITTMEIETIQGNGKSEPPVIMDMHFNANEPYTGAKFTSDEMKKQGDLFIIYDFKNSAMLMLMSSDKDKFSFAYDWKQALEKVDEITDHTTNEETNGTDTDQWPNFTQMGTKTILGYLCNGYRSESDREIMELWMSPDADFGSQRMFRAHANAKQMKGKIPEHYPQGMILEMTSKNKSNGDKTTMKVTKINKNAHISYVMADFPRMSFNANAESINEE